MSGLEFRKAGSGRLDHAVVLGEVDSGLDAGQKIDDGVSDRLDPSGEFSLQAVDGGGKSFGCLCRDQVEDGFGLGEIEAAVQEGPLREFPSLGRARPCTDDFGKDGPEDQRAAVAADLERVFAGVGVGSLQKGDEDIVEDGPRLRGHDLAVVEMMGEKCVKGPRRSEQAPGNPFRLCPADPNQADPPDAGRRRNGGYGVPADHGIRVSLRIGWPSGVGVFRSPAGRQDQDLPVFPFAAALGREGRVVLYGDVDDTAVVGVHMTDRHRFFRLLHLFAELHRHGDKGFLTPFTVSLRIDDDHLVAVHGVMHRLVDDILDGVQVLPPLSDEEAAPVPFDVQDDRFLRLLHTHG